MTDLADIDQQLEALGPQPDDIEELLARYGEDDLGGDHIDSLLDSLSQGVEPPEVEALGVEREPPPAPKAGESAPTRDTMVDHPSEPVAIEDDFKAAPAVDALFSSAPDGEADEEDDVEVSFEGGDGDVDAADLEAATDGLFDTLEDAEPVVGAPEAPETRAAELEEPGKDEPPRRSSLPPARKEISDERRSDLKALLREEIDPSDFPQTRTSQPPPAVAVPPAAAAPAADDDDDFELLVDEDDIEEIDIDDEEFEIIED